VKQGKVRDLYESQNESEIVCVTTNRQSAFDRVLTHVPYKGQVTNMTSAWWFFQTESIVPNALVCVPHPYVTVMKKLTPLPVEIIVRGYMTGSTKTSLWTAYDQGARTYCGHTFPDGLVRHQALDRPIVTPTTKGSVDVPMSGEELVDRGYLTETQWRFVSEAAMKLFAHGQREAAKRGLILVDTKYEFGVDDRGDIRLMDEVHTPDSSRYWMADTYEARVRDGLVPESVDKDLLRNWYQSNCDPYRDTDLPEAPPELVDELSRRYVYLFETITGLEWTPAEWNEDDITESVRAFWEHS
jgi:phosphoribosylaminoimidazole-succinocarboxamide synthase